MAIADRDASRPIDPGTDIEPRRHVTAPRSERALRLVPDAPQPEQPSDPATAHRVDGVFDLHPGQVERTQELSQSVGTRMAVRAGRWESSLVAYFLILLAGAVVGVQVAATFLAGRSGACTGADAVGRCVLDQLAAPALTRFALVLICAHGLATLLLDVVPEVVAKVRAGYRPRRARRPALLPPPAPGEPVSVLAAACWAPVQATRTMSPARTTAVARRPSQAVCPACVTIVVALEGTCPDCLTGVVARRG